MCLAELNVSLLPCRHRWFHLSRPCNPSTDLSNCANKLSLSGWEIKCDFCPYCAGWNITPAEYRLIGNDVTPAVGGLTRTPSLTLAATRRETRKGSISRSDSTNSITMMASEKNKAMNARVEAYLRVAPTPESSARPAPLQEVDDESELGITSTPSDTASEGQDSIRQPSTSSQFEKAGFMNRVRRKSKKLSRGMFK